MLRNQSILVTKSYHFAQGEALLTTFCNKIELLVWRCLTSSILQSNEFFFSLGQINKAYHSQKNTLNTPGQLLKFQNKIGATS